MYIIYLYNKFQNQYQIISNQQNNYNSYKKAESHDQEQHSQSETKINSNDIIQIN